MLQHLAPANNGFDVTPSDTTTFNHTNRPRGLYIGVTGDVAVEFEGGATATFTAVPAGTILPICPAKILSTGTTATNITALV